MLCLNFNDKLEAVFWISQFITIQPNQPMNRNLNEKGQKSCTLLNLCNFSRPPHLDLKVTILCYIRHRSLTCLYSPAPLHSLASLTKAPPYKVSPFAYPFICLNLSISHQLSKCPSYQLQLNFWIAQYPDIPIEFDNSINLDPLHLIPQTTAVCTLWKQLGFQNYLKTIPQALADSGYSMESL